MCLFPVFMFAFIFSMPLIFTWPLAFLICLPSSFSVIHVSVNIKNNVKKDTTLFYFLKVRAAMRFSSVAFGLPHLLIEFFLYWCACGADGRSVARALSGHVISKFSRMGRFTQLSGSTCARFARALSSAIICGKFCFLPLFPRVKVQN